MGRRKGSMVMHREGNEWGQNLIKWAEYSPIKMQYFRERTPQKLWLELLGKSHVGLIYWSALVEFFRNLFWFQLKAGGLAPELGFLVYLFMPSVALGRPAFRQFLDTHPWSRALLVVGGVLGLCGEFQPSITRRLALSACSVGLLGIYVWEGMWAAATARRERTAFGMVGGILLLQVLRWAYAGPNPVVARWWGLLFLAIIPGICAALLVLYEDLAESEGAQLQSFIEEDENLEMEQIEPMRTEDDVWRFKNVQVFNYKSLASNSIEDQNLGATIERQNMSTTVSVPHCNELGTPMALESTRGEIAFVDDDLQNPVQGSSSEELGKKNCQQGTSTVEDWTVREMVENDAAKLSMDDTFQAWSWGFGGEAFRQATSDDFEMELEVVDIPAHTVRDGFDGMVRGEPQTQNLRQLQVMDERLDGLHTSSDKVPSSLKSVGSPMKNKRWDEGEEVPWLMDIIGNNDISDSELNIYRHKDTKWNFCICMRTVQMGIGSGSLLFLTHWVLTAPTSFSRWQGLSSDLGWVSIFSLTFGLIAATEYPRILCLRKTQGLLFWVFAAVGASILMWSSTGTMIGSALVAFSAPSLWISVAQCNLQKYTGGGLGIMVSFYIVLLLWSTSLVAYQSIPVLHFLRGTRGLLMGCSVAGIGLGLGRQPIVAAKERGTHGGMWRGLFNSEIDAHGRQAVAVLIALVGLIWAVAFGVRHHHSSNAISVEGPLRILNFNVQQGFNRGGTANYDTIFSMLQKEQPHFVMLQETDMMHIAHGNLDMIDYWATHLKIHSLYAPSTKLDTWGCSILSIYPFIYSESGVLSSPEGENACYQYAQVDIAGKVVHLVNTHFGTLEDEIALQAQQLAEIVRHVLNPAGEENVWLILAGDLNAAPLSLGYNLTISSGLRDAYVSKNGEWKGPGDRDPGAGYVFSSLAFNCTSWTEPHYDQQKTADGYPIVVTFDFP